MKLFTLKNNKNSKKIKSQNPSLSVFGLSTKKDWHIALIFSSLILVVSLVFLANFYFSIKTDLETVESQEVAKKLTIDEKKIDSLLDDLLERRSIKSVIPTSNATTTTSQSIDDM